MPGVRLQDRLHSRSKRQALRERDGQLQLRAERLRSPAPQGSGAGVRKASRLCDGCDAPEQHHQGETALRVREGLILSSCYGDRLTLNETPETSIIHHTGKLVRGGGGG